MIKDLLPKGSKEPATTLMSQDPILGEEEMNKIGISKVEGEDGVVETTPRYIKICERLIDRKKIEEIYDYFKAMDRGEKGYISLEGKLKAKVDYEEKFNEMESLRGVSHLVFKDLKSGSNRLTFLDLLRILLVTSNPDDLKVCESWVKEQEQISKITR